MFSMKTLLKKSKTLKIYLNSLLLDQSKTGLHEYSQKDQVYQIRIGLDQIGSSWCQVSGKDTQR